MIEQKIEEIRAFCRENSDQKIIDKYQRYFKEGYDGYGVEDKLFQSQRDKWLEEWQQEMSFADYLQLGDLLVQSGRFEEIAYAIHFVAAFKDEYSPEAFEAIGTWLENGIANWASTDILCMLVLSHFINEEIVDARQLAEWAKSTSKWKRRAVPVTLVEAVKLGREPDQVLPLITALMLNEAEDVQKGLGTLLRTLEKVSGGDGKFSFGMERLL